MADANCEVTYTREEDCCDVDLGGSVIEPPPEPPPPEPEPEPPPEEDSGCPYYCGFGSPEGVQESVFEEVDVIGGEYLQMDVDPTSHPWWAKMSVGGNTGWRPWAGLGSEGLLAYRIGDGSLASGNAALAFGTGSLAAALRSIAIGEGTQATGDRAEAIGYNSIASAADAKAFGSGAQALGVSSIAHGVDTIAYHNNCIAIGQGALSGSDDTFDDGFEDSTGNISIGFQAHAGIADVDENFVFRSIAIGYQPKAFGMRSIAIGDRALAGTAALDWEAIAIGGEAKTAREFAGISEQGQIVIGTLALATGADAVVVGYKSESRGDDTNATTIIGSFADDVGDCNVLGGFDTLVRGNGCIAIGSHAGVLGKGSSSGVDDAIGGESDALGSFAFINGADGAMAFGPRSRVEADANESIALGHNANAGQLGVISIGSGAKSNKPFQLMLGAGLAPFIGSTPGVASVNFNSGSIVGIIANPNGTCRFIDTDGAIVTKVANYTIVRAVDNGNGFYIDATGGNIVITMEAWSAGSPQRYWFRRMDASANTVTINVAGGTDEFFNQEANTYVTTTTLTTQYQLMTAERISATGGHPTRFRYYKT